MKKVTMFVLGLMFMSTLVGCETFKGIGQDIKNTGDNIYDVVSGRDRTM